jgi:hypothetical protein
MAKLTPALALAVLLANLGALGAQEMAKPLGKWERKIGKSHVTLVIEDNRLHATFIGDKPCIIHADYALTRDGVVFGVVTSIECDEDEDSARSLFDAPFSCRFRIDEGALIIHDLKCHEVDSKDDVWNGRFKAVGSVPNHIEAISPSPPTSPPKPSGPVSNYNSPYSSSWNAPAGYVR